MPTRFIVRHLSGDKIPQAFAVFQTVSGACTLDRWRSYAGSRLETLGAVRDGGAGIVSVENERGYIHGLFAYRVDLDPRCGRVLDCDNLIALHLVNPRPVLGTLMQAMETLARERRCEALHVRVGHTDPAGQSPRSTQVDSLEQAGLALESIALCKKLGPGGA